MLQVEDRLINVMTAPLSSIIDTSYRECASRALVRAWDLPESDRAALTGWGLPRVQQMRPHFQDEPVPALVPNVAGERERSLISPEQRLYKLIHWRRDDLQLRIGAVAGTGRVLMLRPKPVTTADVPPALQEHYPDLYKPAVCFLSSSVRQFVEIAWRWRAALPVLLDLYRQEPHYTRPQEELVAHFDRMAACWELVLGHIERIDTAVRADDPGSLWRSIVTDL